MSAIEDTIALHIRAHKLPEPVREYPFVKAIGWRWRFDFAWPDLAGSGRGGGRRS